MTPPGLLMFTFLAARLFQRVSPRSSTVADTAGFCAGTAGTGTALPFAAMGAEVDAAVTVPVWISASSICVSPVAVVDTSGTCTGGVWGATCAGGVAAAFFFEEPERERAGVGLAGAD